MKVLIEMAVLQAALITAPKKDIRYYLNGVYISQNKLVSTDGHRLFAYDLEGAEEFEPFIIPRESIETLSRSLSAKDRKTAQVEISGDKLVYKMAYSKTAVNFEPIDGRYPDFERVIPAKYEPSIHGSYRWQYMADFAKISKLLGCKLGLARLLTNGMNSALVELPDTKATCVIMPARD